MCILLAVYSSTDMKLCIILNGSDPTMFWKHVFEIVAHVDIVVLRVAADSFNCTLMLWVFCSTASPKVLRWGLDMVTGEATEVQWTAYVHGSSLRCLVLCDVVQLYVDELWSCPCSAVKFLTGIKAAQCVPRKHSSRLFSPHSTWVNLSHFWRAFSAFHGWKECFF